MSRKGRSNGCDSRNQKQPVGKVMFELPRKHQGACRSTCFEQTLGRNTPAETRSRKQKETHNHHLDVRLSTLSKAAQSFLRLSTDHLVVCMPQTRRSRFIVPVSIVRRACLLKEARHGIDCKANTVRQSRTKRVKCWTMQGTSFG